MNSRRKGTTSERAVEVALQSFGLSTDRNIGGRIQVAGDIRVEQFALEVRNRQKLSVVSWCRDHEASVPNHLVPALVFRSNREPYRVAMRLDDWAELVKAATG